MHPVTRLGRVVQQLKSFSDLHASELEMMADELDDRIGAKFGSHVLETALAVAERRTDDAGVEIRSFCIHPTERVPDADSMLAQKLMLETDHDRFLKTANAHDLVPRTDGRRAA